MPVFPKLKLTYFDDYGRAETIRLAFVLGGIPFEDERLSWDAFVQRKPTFVYGQLPVLEVDGVEMAQSQALLRYAGKLAGLYPANDPLSALRIDEIVGAFDELQDKLSPSFVENDPDKKKAMRLELANVTIPRYLAQIEARVTKLQALAHFETDRIFIHDLLIYAYLQALRFGGFEYIPTDIADSFKLLNASEAKVLADPKVQQWNAMRSVGETKYKLTYFNGTSRGEPIRLAFVIGGIPFEDERISHDELVERRASLPFGQLPVLEVNGELISQSNQILRYVGTLAGLYPVNDPVLALRIDEMLGAVDDVYTAIADTMDLDDPNDQANARASLRETKLLTLLTGLENRIMQWGGPSATGPALSIADLTIYSVVITFFSGKLTGVPATFIESFPNLQRIRAQVRDHEKVKNATWLAKK